MTRTAAGSDRAITAQAADRSQADYFRNLLVECRDEIDQTIAKYRDELATYDGRASGARTLRRMIRHAEWERHELDRMIGALDQRFPLVDRPALRSSDVA